MRFFSFFIFLLFHFHTTFLYAQVPANPLEITGDTIEGTSTDTSIVYIIKRPPITIKEKVEIERTRLKKNIYFTIGLAGLVNTNKYKSNNTSEDYIKSINSATTPQPGVGSIVQMYLVPKNFILGLAINGQRMNEEFRYTPADSIETTFQNSYTYAAFGVSMGKWYRKQKKISYQLMAYPTLEYKFGVSGYSLNSTDPKKSVFIEESIAYKNFNTRLFLSFKLLYRINNSFIEIGPYAMLTPFSMTKKNEVYSITRNSLGIFVNLTNKLF